MVRLERSHDLDLQRWQTILSVRTPSLLRRIGSDGHTKCSTRGAEVKARCRWGIFRGMTLNRDA
jgi:hypothetical protein